MSIKEYFALLDLRDRLYYIDNSQSRKAIEIINKIVNIKQY